jgi:hypothetical protein
MYSKKIQKLIILTILITLIIPILSVSSFLDGTENKETRIQDYVKFSDMGIFYNIQFPKNDITGTGDILQDSPYRSLCVLKNCPFKCCTGEINALVCASQEQCKEFYDAYTVGNVIAAVIFPIFFFSIFLIFFICFHKRCKKIGLSALLAFGCTFIFTIPIIIFVIWKFKLFKLCDENEEEKRFLF